MEISPTSALDPTILHVEDDDIHAYLLRAAFQKARLPVRIHRVANCQAAINYLSVCETPPALIVLDLKMRLLSGWDVLAWLRHQKRLASVPIVILSSSEAPEDRERAAELGVKAYLHKTPSWDTAATTIEGLLRA